MDVAKAHDRAYFDGYAAGGTVFGEQRLYDARVRLRWVGEPRGSGDILEVGCAAGHFLAEARLAGWRPAGVEQSRYAVESGVAKDIPVEIGLLEDASLETASFDVVCAWHVLEHIPDPQVALERLCEALRPGGQIYLEVPNIACARARKMRMSWAHLDPERHLHHFAPQSLRLLLERAGFRAVTTTTVSPWSYLPSSALLKPRMLARRVRYSQITRTLRSEHWDRHDMLRATGFRY